MSGERDQDVVFEAAPAAQEAGTTPDTTEAGEDAAAEA
ncbi:hypothetical protein PF004_g18441 [Phytophthora fragariae]|uniref:Uncharacterized protein n=1 Tax=Phytophthora fragariae TaxID=53985 RepID=A0A6G0NCH4_9STRA|nr:hypothetical protein PF004_g18441 [Phytophthora fragariae]